MFMRAYCADTQSSSIYVSYEYFIFSRQAQPRAFSKSFLFTKIEYVTSCSNSFST